MVRHSWATSRPAASRDGAGPSDISAHPAWRVATVCRPARKIRLSFGGSRATARTCETKVRRRCEPQVQRLSRCCRAADCVAPVERVPDLRTRAARLFTPVLATAVRSPRSPFTATGGGSARGWTPSFCIRSVCCDDAREPLLPQDLRSGEQGIRSLCADIYAKARGLVSKPCAAPMPIFRQSDRDKPAPLALP
jgi:hypothetical protein